MKALIVLPDRDVSKWKERLNTFFDDYDVQCLSPSENEYYFWANKLVNALREDTRPVFVILTGNVSFLCILAVKLIESNVNFKPAREHFQIAEWTGKRFRILKVP